MRRLSRAILAVPLFAIACASPVDREAVTAASLSPAPGEPELAAVRAATERFQDVNVALAAGYIRDPFDLCDTAQMMGRPPELGAMGVHYFRPDLLGITAPRITPRQQSRPEGMIASPSGSVSPIPAIVCKRTAIAVSSPV